MEFGLNGLPDVVSYPYYGLLGCCPMLYKKLTEYRNRDVAMSKGLLMSNANEAYGQRLCQVIGEVEESCVVMSSSLLGLGRVMTTESKERIDSRIKKVVQDSVTELGTFDSIEIGRLSGNLAVYHVSRKNRRTKKKKIIKKKIRKKEKKKEILLLYLHKLTD